MAIADPPGSLLFAPVVTSASSIFARPQSGRVGGEELERQAIYAYSSYPANLQVWNFMELSIEGGAKYKDGRDDQGAWIFQQHKKETRADALNRKNRASVLNYCAFFSTRFMGYLAAQAPTRVGSSDVDWIEFEKDATGAGKSLASFMKDAQAAALEASPAWIGIDAPRTDVPLVSELDRRQRGVRPQLFLVDPRNVIDYDMHRGRVTRIVIREARRVKPDVRSKEGEAVYFIEWFDNIWIEYQETHREDEGKFYAIPTGLAGVNYLGTVPFRPLHFQKPPRKNPLFSQSMLHDCASLQRDIFRLYSLFSEELFNRTFSTTVISGSSPEELGSQLQQTLIVLDDPDASVRTAGADTSQAKSLLDSLKWLIRQIHRVAQFESSGDPQDFATRTAESGKKKGRDLEGLYQALARYSAATETVENDVIRMWAEMLNKNAEEYARSSYPVDFNVVSTTEQIEQVTEAALAEFPRTFLAELKTSVMERLRPQMAEKKWKQIDAELEVWVNATVDDVVDSMADDELAVA